MGPVAVEFGLFASTMPPGVEGAGAPTGAGCDEEELLKGRISPRMSRLLLLVLVWVEAAKVMPIRMRIRRGCRRMMVGCWDRGKRCIVVCYRAWCGLWVDVGGVGCKMLKLCS
jgi:hypothetical protein